MQKITEATSTLSHGLVISYFGSSVAVEATNGQVFQCHLYRNQELPIVGDQVVFAIENENNNLSGVVVEIKPRFSLLAKGDHRGQMKPLAANVDYILIVMAPPPIFSEYLVDRYLVAAELLKIKPIIVLNKEDTLTEKRRAVAVRKLNIYQKVPYPVFFSSIYQPESLAKIADLLQIKTGVLVGPSGVGKSSIITSLGNLDLIRTGNVTVKGAGKHTTTATRLYHLPTGGQLIDSPGVREFNLWPITKKEVLSGFLEFKPFLTGCKFRDCQHLVEPGCKVQAAVNTEEISLKRFQSYQTLMKQAL